MPRPADLVARPQRPPVPTPRIPRRAPAAIPLLLGLALACTAAARPAPAGQTDVEVIHGPTDVVLRYRLQDRDGQSHPLRLYLPRDAVDASRRRFHAYRPDELRDLAEQETRRGREALVQGLSERWPAADVGLDADGTIRWRIGPPADYEQRQLRRYDGVLAGEIDAIRAAFPEAGITAQPDGYRITARDQRTLDEIKRRLSQAQASANAAVEDYAADLQSATDRDIARMRAEVQAELGRIDDRMAGFADAFFHERLYRIGADDTLHPDYRRIARIEAAELDTVVPALRGWLRGLDLRAGLERLLLFTQSIPYDPLRDRADSAGFLPPLQLLAENRGDCDSKSVLFAALAHRLYPDLDIGMALIPGHAFLVLGLSAEPGDDRLDWSGRAWVVAEPVGPANTRLGELSDQSAGAAVDEMIRLF
jgi:hypothetical protein